MPNTCEFLADPRRLGALARNQSMDTGSDENFDRLTRLAADLMEPLRA